MKNTQDKYLQLFGLFELDDAGTILYSRPGENGGQQDGHSVVGKNFFDELGGIDNDDLLRRHFRKFLESNRPVDSFIFDGVFSETPVRAKVLMARGYEAREDSASGIVIMDIKKHTSY
jgi:hypothetical protein